jgi:serine/threonine protein phosphatase PrpC
VTDHAVIADTSLRWAARTDVGLVRALNEDSLLAMPQLFVVADGMGGHDAGEIASQLTAARLAGVVQETPDDPASSELLSAEIRSVNAELFATGDEGTVMGTTVTGLAITDHSGLPAWLAFNVGDSRVYSWYEQQLQQVTTDHSFVQELVDSGQIEPDAARSHHQRNVITRALGAESAVDADYWIRPIRVDEWFVVCSDGLTGEVTDAAIADVLASAGQPAEAADALITLALANGGRDNVTVIVVEVTGAGDTIDITTETRDRSTGEVSADGTMIRFVPAAAPSAADSSSSTGALIESLPEVLRVEDPDADDTGANRAGAAATADLIESIPATLSGAAGGADDADT